MRTLFNLDYVREVSNVQSPVSFASLGQPPGGPSLFGQYGPALLGERRGSQVGPSGGGHEKTDPAVRNN